MLDSDYREQNPCHCKRQAQSSKWETYIQTLKTVVKWRTRWLCECARMASAGCASQSTFCSTMHDAGMSGHALSGVAYEGVCFLACTPQVKAQVPEPLVCGEQLGP